MLIRPTKTVPSPGVPLRQIKFVINFMSSEGKLSRLVRCNITLLHYYRVPLLINYLSIFICYLFVCLFVLVVSVSFVSYSFSVVICVCTLCYFCNWPPGC
jgi:hypothetical protein